MSGLKPAVPASGAGRWPHVDWDSFRTPEFGFRALLVVAGVVLVWTRIAGTASSLANDEAYTFVHYISQGPRGIFTNSYVPNNHILFNLLSWATVGIFGYSEPTLRFWSVAPAVAGWLLIVVWSWQRLGAATAAAAGVLLALSPLHLDLTQDARGYGLIFLASAAAIATGDWAARGRAPQQVWLLGLIGFLGIITMPVFVLFFLAHMAVVAVLRPGLRLAAAVTTAVVGVASLATYAPVLDEVVAATGQEFGAPLSWYGVVTGPADAFVAPVLRGLIPPTLAGIVAVVAFTVLASLGAALLWKRNDGVLLATAAVPLFIPFVALWALQFFVEERFVSPATNHAVLLVSLGIVHLVMLLRHRVAQTMVVAILVVGSLAGFRILVALDAHWAAVPKQDFQTVGRIIRGTGTDRVVTNSARPVMLQHYAGQPIEIATGAPLQQLLCDEQTAFVFVEHEFQNEPADTSCLEAADAAMIHVRQRNPGTVNVWIVPERSSSTGG